MTVTRLSVDSFARMRAARVHPKSVGLVPVRGKNAQGKSSLIGSMMAALQGARSAPEEPITSGAHRSTVEVDLGDILIRRKWTRGGTGGTKSHLEVVGKDGAKFGSPQKLLDSLTGRFADPIAFLSLPPADQVKTVLGVVGLSDQLAELESEESLRCAERTDAGRDARRLRATADSLAGELERTRPDGDFPTESRSELAEQLEAIRIAKSEDDSLRAKMTSAVNRGEEAKRNIDRLKVELLRWEEEIESCKVDYSEAKAALSSVVIADAEPILEKLDSVDSRSDWIALEKNAQAAESAAQEAESSHAAAESKVEDARASIGILLSEAPFPVEGMEYDPEAKSLRLNGVPFSQASQAERLRAAACVAMAGRPRIRVIFARDGSLLDSDSKQVLAEEAESRGFQFWIEEVDETREGPGIFIEDGEAFEVDGPDGEAVR